MSSEDGSLGSQYRKPTPYPRPVYDESIGKVVPPDNQQAESLEHRAGINVIPQAEQSQSSVFMQEDPTGNQTSRLLTPEAAGVQVVTKEGTSSLGGTNSPSRRVITGPPENAYTFQTGPGNEPNPNATGQEETGSGHSVRYQSEAWWQEDRIKRNPYRKGESEK